MGEKKKNGIGTAGFILSLLGLIFCWFPIVGYILLGLGFIFSVIGVFKAPRGMAITGIILSCIGSVLAVAIGGALIGYLTSIIN